MEQNTFFRKATLEDFFDDDDEKTRHNNKNNKKNKSYSQNDNTIDKNQQEFGHKKRIKP